MNPPAINYVYNAVLARCVDGDTVFLQVDLGFRVFGNFNFRLLRINAPEMQTPTVEAGKAAKQALIEMLAGKSLRVGSQKSDKYGRWLGDIWVQNQDGTWFNANDEMVARGFAVAYEPA